MTTLWWRVPACACLTLCACATTGAQEGPAGRGLWGVGLGIANGTMSVGGESGSASGPTVHARLGTAVGRRTLLLLDAELQQFEVASPVIAESFRSTYILLAVQRYVHDRVHARASAGYQLRRWSGPERVTDSDGGVALGFAMGAEVPLTQGFLLAPDVILNWAFIEAEGSVSARLIGLRVGLARHF